MSKYNIKGPFLNIVKDMYQKLIYSIKTENVLSNSFEIKIGVKLDCVLSTTFFSLYLNDLSKCFDDKCDPVPLGNCGLHISCLMYADDIVLLSKIVSEYDQEIPQSQTADNPVAPQGRAAQPS